MPNNDDDDDVISYVNSKLCKLEAGITLTAYYVSYMYGLCRHYA